MLRLHGSQARLHISEVHCLHLVPGGVLQPALEYIAVLSEDAGTDHSEIALRKKRLRVALSERLKELEFPDELFRDIWKRKEHVNGHLHLEILLSQVRKVIDGLPEPLYISFFQGQPCRQLMAAELGEKSPAAAHLGEHIVGLDGSARALHALLRLCQDKGGSVVALLDPPGDDPGDALVAVREIDDQHLIILKG